MTFFTNQIKFHTNTHRQPSGIMATKPPRGLQTVKRTNKDGTKVLRWRVQFNRDGFKRDKLFDDYAEALEYLNACKSYTGKDKIKLLEELSEEKKRLIDEYLTDPPLSTCIESYRLRYITPKYSGIDESSAEGKIKLRNYKTTLSFFKTIKETKIKKYVSDEWEISPVHFRHSEEKIQFGMLKPIEITENEINEYIISRLEDGVKPISIKRELTHISNIFKKIKYLNPKIKTINNPTTNYDKDLLLTQGNLQRKKGFRLSDDERIILMNSLQNYENKEMGNIVNLMLETALRRSEVVLLKADQINYEHGYLHLHYTKSGRPRKVYLTTKAVEILKNIKPHDNGRLFKYTVLGWDGSFKKLMERIGLSHIKPHSLRKESISSMLDKVASSGNSHNSIVLAEILGLASVRKLEEHLKEHEPADINTQRGVLSTVGHASSQVTGSHYYTIKK
jgi:integrase